MSFMYEVKSKTLALLSFFLWPISGVFVIYALGAWIIQGDWQLFLIAVGIFAFVNILSVIISIYE